MTNRFLSGIFLLFCVLPATADARLEDEKSLNSVSFLAQSQQSTYLNAPLSSNAFSFYFTRQSKKYDWLSVTLGTTFDFSRNIDFIPIQPENPLGSIHPDVQFEQSYFIEWKRIVFSTPLLAQVRLLHQKRFSFYLGAGVSTAWTIRELYRGANYKTRSSNSPFDPGPYKYENNLNKFFQDLSVSPIIAAEASYDLNNRYSFISRVSAFTSYDSRDDFALNVGIGIKRKF